MQIFQDSFWVEIHATKQDKEITYPLPEQDWSSHYQKPHK